MRLKEAPGGGRVSSASALQFNTKGNKRQPDWLTGCTVDLLPQRAQ